MRVVFFGTPDVAVPSLQALLSADDVDVTAVVTNPDRPRGRRSAPQPPPVKVAAADAGVGVWQPRRPAEILEALRSDAPEVCAVVAYGSLLPAQVLAAGGAGFVNLHFSLLPRWRGAAPVQHAIRSGDTTTGITTFVLDEGMDTGPILAQHPVPIRSQETAGELLDRLAELGAPHLVASLHDLVGGTTPRPQPVDGATLAPKLTPADGAVDFAGSAQDVVNLIRSAAPRPGAHTRMDGQRMKLFQATVVEGGGGAPGQITRLDPDGPVVACGDGHVRLEILQPAGKARMDAGAWARGHHPDLGTRLGA